jgi:transcriptional regulator with XRE-family HTH domain
MSDLATWLETQMERRSLSLLRTALLTRVGAGTLSSILHEGHIPKLVTLFRLADFFDTPRLDVVRMAAGEELEETEVAGREDDALVRKLVREFQRLPAEWKQEAVAQVEMMNRLNELSARSQGRLIGEEAEDDEDGDADEEAAGAP